MTYELKGGAFPVVVCQLADGEKMVTEKGSMVWMSPNMEMSTSGGGLGKIAINYGYYKYNYAVMLIAVVFIVILVQIFQSLGTSLATRTDHRITNRAGRRKLRRNVSRQINRDKRSPGGM